MKTQIVVNDHKPVKHLGRVGSCVALTAFLMTAFLMGGASAYCPGIASLASVRLIRWTAEQSSVSMHMDVGTFSNIEVYS